MEQPQRRPKLKAQQLSFFYGESQALREINLEIPEQQITALIGPSGCGKSTLLRVFNRMYDLVPGARATGSAQLDEEEILTTRRLLELRRRVGMVFQRPTPFPFSIWENIAIGPRLLGWKRSQIDEAVERSLREAALWDEVANRLKASPSTLSGGQLQRLSIARCIALDPEVILMDEPCSALDPQATSKIEDLMRRLRQHFTILIVTHNMHQAARVADLTAFMLKNPEAGGGELVEVAPTSELFQNPRDSRTEEYIAGRFG